MIALISPSLAMEKCSDECMDLTIPVQIDKAKTIVSYIKKLDLYEIKSLMKVNDKITYATKSRYENIKFDCNGSPAILSYKGLVYKNMYASVFDRDDIEFCAKHIRILSGLYGVLKPYDSIYEYRLELKTKFAIENSSNLYEYFGSTMYDNIVCDDREIVNICSNEYSRAIIPYLTDKDRFVTCSFKVKKNGALRVITTEAKAGRGKMANFIVKNKINNVELLRDFNYDGYKFDRKLSSKDEYVFVKNIFSTS